MELCQQEQELLRQKLKGKYLHLLHILTRSMRYQAHMKERKEKTVHRLFAKQESENVPDYSPFKKKYPNMYTSFVRRRSSMVCKLLTSKPATAVAILKHVWDQEYKTPEKKVLMNKYWTRNASLADLMLDIGNIGPIKMIGNCYNLSTK